MCVHWYVFTKSVTSSAEIKCLGVLFEKYGDLKKERVQTRHPHPRILRNSNT